VKQIVHALHSYLLSFVPAILPWASLRGVVTGRELNWQGRGPSELKGAQAEGRLAGTKERR